MAFKIELIAERPILLNNFVSYFEQGDILAMAEAANNILDTLDHRVYFVNAINGVKLTLGDIMEGAEMLARRRLPALNHRNNIETLVVTKDPMVIMAAKSMNSYVFGNVRLRTFDTLEEVFAYIDAKIVSKSVFE